MKTHLATLTLLALATVAHADDNWMVRGRAVQLIPSNDGGDASIGGKPFARSGFTPEVDLTYFITPNLAVEAIAGTTEHEMRVNRRPGKIDLGTVRVLPPTVTAQYHLECGNWKPYVGAGLTYAHFYDAEHPGFGSVKYDDTWGPALQAGVDYKVGKNLYLNADIKKILLTTDVTVNDTITAKANLNPTVLGLGVGLRF